MMNNSLEQYLLLMWDGGLWQQAQERSELCSMQESTMITITHALPSLALPLYILTNNLHCEFHTTHVHMQTCTHTHKINVHVHTHESGAHEPPKAAKERRTSIDML